VPIYEFKCSSCGVIIEKIMKLSDAAPSLCKCGSQNKLIKLMSRTNFVLKGQGWYETDFKDKKQNKSSQGQTSSSSDEKDQKPSDSKSKQDSKNNKSSIKNKPKKSQSSVTS
jgi:putative FmdB family regulatory protein